MTPTDTIRAFLEQAQQRADAATEGPWTCDYPVPSYEVHSMEGPVSEMTTETSSERDCDAAFIADARTTVPKLVRALRYLIEHLDGEPIDTNEEALAEVANILNAESSGGADKPL